MVQCEMCGAETASPRTAKIEGATLQVCDDCVDFGTEIRQQSAGGSSAKYSTGRRSGSRGGAGTAGASRGSSGGGPSRRRRDPFDDLDEIATDYDAIIRQGREAAGLSREELGRQLNEKASFIGKLERGETLPSDAVRKKLERALDIDLAQGASEEEDAEWSGGGGTAGMTLGDVVERKD